MTTITKSFGLPSMQSRAIRTFLIQELRAAPDSGYPMAIAGSVIPSDQPIEEHVGIGAVPRMTKFEGERSRHRLREQKQIVRNEDYEASLEVTADEKIFNHTRQVEQRISGLAQSYTEHWQDLLADLLMLGDATTSIVDNKAFFANDHETGESGAQDNLLTFDASDHTDVTAAEAEKAMLLAAKQILSFKDDKGRVKNSGIRSFEIVVPLDLWVAFTMALKSPLIVDGNGARPPVVASLGGWTFTLHVEPRLTSGVKFYTVASTGTALIRQEVGALDVTMQDENSPLYDEKRLMRFGIFAKRGVGYGDWSQAVQTTFN